MINVLVVDPQRLFRKGIRTLLNEEPDINVTGMSESTEKALELVETLKPDVVLMDLNMSQLGAIQASTKMKEIHSSVRIVYLIGDLDPELIIRCIANGTDGIVTKEIFPDMLVQVIHDAYRGQYILSGEVATLLVNRIRTLTLDPMNILGKRLENKGIHMTKRELEIATLFMNRKTNQQISKQLHLSEGTVKNYISEIYLKLGINQREKAIRLLEKLVVKMD